MVTFGERLKAIREGKAMTQEALADASAVHRVQIARYESGKAVPTWDLVQKLAKALGVTCEAFAEDHDVSKPSKAKKK